VQTWLLALASVTSVSLVALIGIATVSLDEARLRRVAGLLVSFAVGALLGDAFLHLIPEAMSEGSPRGASIAILGGMLLFFVIEKLLRRHEAGALPPLAAINLIGDGIHNLLDGLLIGASYLVSPTLGVSTTLAVLAHEVPQELGDFGVLVHAGVAPRRAILLNLGSAAIATAGTVIALLAGGAISDVLVPIAAGGFVYIAAADLFPELQRDRTWTGLAAQVLLVAAGIAGMAALTLTE
jgi:zinc and cadmium transporter